MVDNPTPSSADVIEGMREALEKAYRALATIEDNSWGSVAGVQRYAREVALEIGAVLLALRDSKPDQGGA